MPRAFTHGEAPDLGILKYTLLQSFQYKYELLLLRELKTFVILASIALATVVCIIAGMKSFADFH